MIKLVKEYETEYIIFKSYKITHNKTLQTKIFSKNEELIGEIKWWGAWRKYVFFPQRDTLFDTKCLNDIINYITDLMNERKNK